MPKSRSERTRSTSFYLYSAITTLGWRRARIISLVEGERGVEQGRLCHVVDERGELVGYQPIQAPPKQFDDDQPSQPSSTSISAGESRKNAGEAGASRTAHLREDRRKLRAMRRDLMGHPLPMEDSIERVRAKVELWPVIGDRRAVRVSPKGARGC
ncbi:MAG TPA: hypothetical protein VM554_12980 [Acidisarcina sp.]|nr:hypothetical protein [Acidisarcina sp.]